MATTLQNIAERVALKIVRRYGDDTLEFAVTAAVEAYYSMCSKVQFEAIQTTGSEISTVADQAEYDLSALDPPVAGIVNVRYTQASGVKRRLKRSSTKVFDGVSSITSTPSPYLYAHWGESIELFQPPNSANDTFRLRYWSMPSISTTNPGAHVVDIAKEWHELLLYETLFRVYHFLETPEKAMALMAPAIMPRQGSPKKVRSFEMGIIPRLWNDLLATRAEREHSDEDFSINPVVRRYTAGRRR